MANTGYLCCEYCAYNQMPERVCDIFGIKTNPFLICRCFRLTWESHAQARRRWPLLEGLAPGKVYATCDGCREAPDHPRAAYVVMPAPKEKPSPAALEMDHP